MLSLIIASTVLSVAALLDGVSTVHFLKNPNYDEQNPLFGKRPSTLRVYLEGSAVIAAEIGIALLVSKGALIFEAISVVGFGFQSGIHIRNAIRNFRLKV